MLHHSILFPMILHLGPIDPLETDDNDVEQEDDTIEETKEKTKELQDNNSPSESDLNNPLDEEKTRSSNEDEEPQENSDSSNQKSENLNGEKITDTEPPSSIQQEEKPTLKNDELDNFPNVELDFLEESGDYSRFKSVYAVGFDYIIQPKLSLSRERFENRNFQTDLLSGVALQLEAGFRLWDGIDDDDVSWQQFRKNATPSASITIAYRSQQITSISSEHVFIDSAFGFGFHSLEETSGLEDYLVGRDGGLILVGTRRNIKNNNTQWHSSLQLQKEIGRHLTQIQFLGTIFHKNDMYPYGLAFSIGTGWRL